jgi:hypothetical protein
MHKYKTCKYTRVCVGVCLYTHTHTHTHTHTYIYTCVIYVQVAGYLGLATDQVVEEWAVERLARGEELVLVYVYVDICVVYVYTD